MRILLILSLFTFFLCGCVQRPHTHHFTNNIVILHDVADKVETIDTLHELFAGRNITVGNRFYWRPSKELILYKIFPYYKKFLTDQGAFYCNRFNCVHFAKTFVVIAHLYYYNFEMQRTEQDIAIGELYYMPDYFLELDPPKEKLGHAINVIILDSGEVMFFEPQTGQQVYLTGSEIASIYYVKF